MIRGELLAILVLGFILFGVIELGERVKRKFSTPRKHFRR